MIKYINVPDEPCEHGIMDRQEMEYAFFGAISKCRCCGNFFGHFSAIPLDLCTSCDDTPISSAYIGTRYCL